MIEFLGCLLIAVVIWAIIKNTRQQEIDNGYLELYNDIQVTKKQIARMREIGRPE